jgi:hypothetical protein
MSLSFRQRALLHQVLRDFDRETGAALVDPTALAPQLGAEVEDLAADVTALVGDGYLEPPSPETPWRLAPTDKGVMSAMGLD